MTTVISSTYKRKCGSKTTTSTVRKVLTVGNSVRLLVVTTTRLVLTPMCRQSEVGHKVHHSNRRSLAGLWSHA
ncbi:hypothetical protein Taro_026153 [Colocasia esculenta]|uniref:Uncharacterized protein n=1 Tax=Colocasia esculenta TaxID=4460 RepID=A0A843VB79_COLES|nr:hypothetical protein [Colocasia esculenta]